MRPQALFPLFASLRGLPGVGPRLETLLAKLTGPHAVDLIWHLPNACIDRRLLPAISAAKPGTTATLKVRIDRHLPARQPRQPYKVLCSDATGCLQLVFFNARPDYLARVLPEGSLRLVSGAIESFGGEMQMPHPDYLAGELETGAIPAIEPVYPLTAGLTNRMLRKIISAALERAPELDEWLDAALIARHGWSGWRDALGKAHNPGGDADLDPGTAPRMRLAYDELLANQLALLLVRKAMQRMPGRAITSQGTSRGALAARALGTLAFRLTGGQHQALREIRYDMAASSRMLRLLQGDVGSGKTVVAALAMLDAVEAGLQAVLMAPTEILARQHLATLAPLADAAGVRVAILTGREKGAARDRLLAELAAGDIQIIVGTHALFQPTVAFADLGLAVIDEQHRFGVDQRLELAGKGDAVDVLVMTATPIPRTLMLTAYGDLDVSRLTEKPPGRQRVDTRAVSLERLDEVIGAIGRGLAAGAKVYWVCPLVEDSLVSDLSAAEERCRQLRACFGERVGLVHGRMKSAEKDRAVSDFATGPIDILVATTVIEVGVDVPDATIMIIEHAERFGLAQLHQLRGRVGRGAASSTCILLYRPPLTGTARERLSILRDTDDGFVIAEEDLRLRGAGELLGVRQSGLPQFRLADLAVHAELLPMARDDAELALQNDPDLTGERGRALRTLLYLFERDAAARYLRTG